MCTYTMHAHTPRKVQMPGMCMSVTQHSGFRGRKILVNLGPARATQQEPRAWGWREEWRKEEREREIWIYKTLPYVV